MVLPYLYIFILERQTQAVAADGKKPLAIAGRHHGQGTRHVPIAQGGLVAKECNLLSRLKLRSLNAEEARTGKEGWHDGWVFRYSRTDAEGIGIAIGRSRPVAPMVQEEVCPVVVNREKARHDVPFAAQHSPSPLDHTSGILSFGSTGAGLRLVGSGNNIRVSELAAARFEPEDTFPEDPVVCFEENVLSGCLSVGRKEAKFDLNGLSPFRSVFNGEM